jgi:hypothetical protein
MKKTGVAGEFHDYSCSGVVQHSMSIQKLKALLGLVDIETVFELLSFHFQ